MYVRAHLHWNPEIKFLYNFIIDLKFTFAYKCFY